MVYQKDISAVLGLSVSTVSRALRGYSDISEETRKKVLKAAEDLDYDLDRERAPRPAYRMWGAVAVLAPGYADLMKSYYYRDLIIGMAVETADSHRDLVIMGEDEADKQMSWVGRTAARRVDGICLLANRDDLYKGRYADLLESNIPVVSVENELAGCTSVCRDFRGGARTLLNYLKNKGHRRTAYLGDLSLDSKKYASILKEEAQKLDMGFMQIKSEEVAVNGGECIGGDDPVTCVVFTSCREASCYIRDWESRGFRIPEDISVAVVETDHEEGCAEDITRVEDSPAALGREAVRRLILILEHPESDTGERVAVCGRVCEGKTVRDIGGNSARKF